MHHAILRVIVLTCLITRTTVLAGDLQLETQARSILGADQGVYVEAEDGTVLVAQAADRGVHPASVTKIATTLALLRGLGPSHRFTTRVGRAGPLQDGRLAGDLVIQADGDPFLVYENVLRVLERLHDRGLTRVAGRVRVDGPLLFNWQPDPTGERLTRTLTGHDGAAAWPAAATATGTSLAGVALRIDGTRGDGGAGPAALVIHESAPLLRIVKALNGYSNNVFHFLADRVGGTGAVQHTIRSLVPTDWHDEVIIENGAGGGATNRLSPRVTVAVLRALERDLAAQHLDLPDVLPVAGRDPGTLRARLPDRTDRGALVGKTGTYGSVGACALAGVIRTKRWGRLAFAVLNHNVPVPDARAQQDAFVRALLDAGEGVDWVYQTIPVPTVNDARVRDAD